MHKYLKISIATVAIAGVVAVGIWQYVHYQGIFSRAYVVNDRLFSMKFPNKPSVASNNIGSNGLSDFFTYYQYQNQSSDSLDELSVGVEQFQDTSDRDSQFIADYFLNAATSHLNQNFIFKKTMQQFPETIISQKVVTPSYLQPSEREIDATLQIKDLNRYETERFILSGTNIFWIKGGAVGHEPTAFSNFADTFQIKE